MNAQRRLLLHASASTAMVQLIARSDSVQAALDTHAHDADPKNAPHDGMHDFDFLFGRWTIRNERLRERLVGSDDWESFDATGECRPVIGGYGNTDDYVTDWNGGLVGMTLRLFNRQTQRWSIYWASSHTGALELPVTGTFSDGVGRFEGKDFHKGKPVLQRFLWSDITPTNAKWEQALSPDGGKTWEANWRMHFTRSSN